MADYTTGTGNGGIMMIRDNGYLVEFFIKAGSSTTNIASMGFNWVINGAAGSSSVRIPSGGNWVLVASFNIGTSQNIKFGIGATGTYGLGGPTDLWQYINRASVPGAPSGVSFSGVTGNSVYATFSGGSDGGSAITGWQLGYSSDPNGPQVIVASNGASGIGGLGAGTVYYFWARGANALGWGPWGPVTSVRTLNVPDAPSGVWFEDIAQTTVTTKFSGYGNGGAPITGWQLGYGSDPTYPQSFLSSGGTNYITGLYPGNTYYFWARGSNSVGWGPWGARTAMRPVAGARVRIGGGWREAVPYVKVNGVWRMARSWIKASGNWRSTN